MNIGLTFLGVLLFLTSVFMMMLILVQRGKGGGLTGALGGMGGQSAFGAKAGDVFTRITVVTAIIWITLCMVTIAAFNPPPSNAGLDNRDDAISAGAEEESDGSAGGGMTAGTESDSDELGDNGEAANLDDSLENFIQGDAEDDSADEANGDDDANASDSAPTAEGSESNGNANNNG